MAGTFDDSSSAYSLIEAAFNGPLLAGVGATTDAGLSSSSYHVLPFDPTTKVTVHHDISIANGVATKTIVIPAGTQFTDVGKATAYRYAVYNVDTIFDYDTKATAEIPGETQLRDNLRRDMVTMIFIMISNGYYHGESVLATAPQQTAVAAVATTHHAEDLTVEQFNRAATFLAARMHTKYQTNHVLGGNPMQASMAATVRAFYQIGTATTAAARKRKDFVASCLHWALHPANETLLIPLVINNTYIAHSQVPIAGPAPRTVVMDEYFQIRSNTPPASTHYFYVAAAAVRQLEPMGILSYIPDPARLSDIATGWRMIDMFGAALHPAANYWGLTRMTANQRLVETLCADLGYAMKKLMPLSSLSASPILAKEDALHGGWKTFIDSVRAAMDAQGAKMVDQKVMTEIRKKIQPTDAGVSFVSPVAGLTAIHRAPQVDAPATPNPSIAAAIALLAIAAPPAPAAAAAAAGGGGGGRRRTGSNP